MDKRKQRLYPLTNTSSKYSNVTLFTAGTSSTYPITFVLADSGKCGADDAAKATL